MTPFQALYTPTELLLQSPALLHEECACLHPIALCQVLKDATSGSKAELAEVADTSLLSMKAWTLVRVLEHLKP